MDTKTYKRCEFIIRQFLSVERPSPELAARFHNWLFDNRHCREKNVIIRKLFYDALPDLIPVQAKDEANLPLKNKAFEKFMTEYEII